MSTHVDFSGQFDEENDDNAQNYNIYWGHVCIHIVPYTYLSNFGVFSTEPRLEVPIFRGTFIADVDGPLCGNVGESLPTSVESDEGRMLQLPWRSAARRLSLRLRGNPKVSLGIWGSNHFRNSGIFEVCYGLFHIFGSIEHESTLF